MRPSAFFPHPSICPTYIFSLNERTLNRNSRIWTKIFSPGGKLWTNQLLGGQRLYTKYTIEGYQYLHSKPLGMLMLISRGRNLDRTEMSRLQYSMTGSNIFIGSLESRLEELCATAKSQ